MKKIFLLLSLIMLCGIVSSYPANNTLVSYYKFDEVSGNALDELAGNDLVEQGTVSNQLGIINNARGSYTTSNYFNGTTGYTLDQNKDYSLSFWINRTGTPSSEERILSIGDVAPTNGYFLSVRVTTGNKLRLVLVKNGQPALLDISSSANIPLNNWTQIVITYDGATRGAEMYINGVLNNSGTASLTAGITTDDDLHVGSQAGSSGSPDVYFDELAVYNGTLNTSSIASLYNNHIGLTYPTTIITTLNDPTNETITVNQTTIFNVTSNIYGGNTLSNATLYLNGINNGTLSLSGISQTYNFSRVLSFGNYTWGVVVSDNEGNTESSVNNTLSVTNLTIDSESYSSTVLSGSVTTFTINITVTSGSLLTSGLLRYNNTNYAGTITDLGSNSYSITRNITTPVVSSDINKTFYWNFTFTGLLPNMQSVIHNQTLTTLDFHYCTAGEVPYVTFDTKAAVNPFPSINATFKSSWDIMTTGSTEVHSKSFEDLTETNSSWSFCFTPNNTNYTVDVDIEVDAINFSPNYHYLIEQEIAPINSNITIYLLNDSLATLTQLKVLDEKQAPLEGVYVYIQFYDLGTDTFYTVSMAKTAYDGTDLSYLNWYNSLYKMIFYKDGEVLLTVNPFKIAETPKIFTVETTPVFIFDKFNEILYNLMYNNVTQNFVLTFIKPSTVTQGCLQVYKRNVTGDYEVCDVCETSDSSTLYCNVASEGNGTFIANFYATGSFKDIVSLIKKIGSPAILFDEIGNLDASTMAILTGGVVASFFFISPVLAVVGVIIGMLMVFSLGFQPLDYGIFISIVLVGGIVAWSIRK